METRGTGAILGALIALTLGTVLGGGSAQAQGWPDVFDPNQLLTLNLTMSPSSWNIIRYDTTFSFEMPAQLWADGEDPNGILVAVRRKPGDALPNESDPFKISLKIDINQYVSGQEWRGLKKLSLENGDDVDVLAEGLAHNIHRMATGPEGYGYDCGLANWVKLYVNGVYRGVYVNQEQRDKRFMQNRGLYVWHETWLYRYEYEGGATFELRVGDDLNPNSPAVQALCYPPFVTTDVSSPHYPPGGPCPTPDDANLIADMDQWVDMQGLLTVEAVNAFVANPDSLFTNYQNVNFLDFNLDDPNETRKRMHFPWDLDATLQDVGAGIYESDPLTTWQTVILGNWTFRTQYNQIIRDLLGGPLSEPNITGFLDQMEPILHDALATDPYNQFPVVDPDPNVNVAARFDALRTWISVRIVNVLAQVDYDQPLHTLSLVVKNAQWGSVTFDPDQLADPNEDPNDPNALRQYPEGTEVVLTAVPIEGKSFRHWRIFDPNYPGDEWYITEDANLVLQLTMDADWEVEAVFKCGSSEAMFPLLAVGIWGTVCRLRRLRRHS